jgi:hypothetical protein
MWQVYDKQCWTCAEVVFISLLHVSLAFRWFACASFSPVGQTDGAGHGRQVFGIDGHLLRKGLKTLHAGDVHDLDLLGTFTTLRKATVSRLPVDGFFRNLVFWVVRKFIEKIRI